jgi:hypothetical protein
MNIQWVQHDENMAFWCATVPKKTACDSCLATFLGGVGPCLCVWIQFGAQKYWNLINWIKIIKYIYIYIYIYKWCKVLAWAFENSWRTWKEQCQSLSLEGFLGSLLRKPQAPKRRLDSKTHPQARMPGSPSQSSHPLVDIDLLLILFESEISTKLLWQIWQWRPRNLPRADAKVASNTWMLVHLRSPARISCIRKMERSKMTKDGQRWPKCQQSHEISGATWSNCSKGWRKQTAKLRSSFWRTSRSVGGTSSGSGSSASKQHLTTSDNISSHHHNVKITTSYSSYGRFMSFWDTRCHQISPGLSKRHFAKCRLTLLETSRNERFASKCSTFMKSVPWVVTLAWGNSDRTQGL